MSTYEDYIQRFNSIEGYKANDLLTFLSSNEENLEAYHDYQVYIEKDESHPVTSESIMQVVQDVTYLSIDRNYICLGDIKKVIQDLKSINEEVYKDT